MDTLKRLFLLMLLSCSTFMIAQTTTVKWNTKMLVGSDDETELNKPLKTSKFTEKSIRQGSEVKIIKVESGNYHQMAYVSTKKKEGWIHRYALQDPSVLMDFIPEIREKYKEDIRNGIVRLGMNAEEAMLAIAIPGGILLAKSSLMSVAQNSIRETYKDDKDLEYYKSYAITTDPQYWEMGFYKNNLCYYMKSLKSVIEYQTKIDWKLVNVEISSNEQNKPINNDSTFLHISEKECYEDDNINISWSVTANNFAFNIRNKKNSSIKIHWDDAVYVDFYGKSNRVIHNGIKYADRNAEQPASVIPRNAILSDVLIPSDNVYFSNFAKMWITRPLITDFACPQQAYDHNLIGKKIYIIFPIQIKDIINEYTFTFELKNVEVYLKSN